MRLRGDKLIEVYSAIREGVGRTFFLDSMAIEIVVFAEKAKRGGYGV